MSAKDLVLWALHVSDEGFRKIISDLRPRPLAQPLPTGGNHALWLIGHLAYVEGSLSHILYGEPNPVGHWKANFGPGSTPQSDPAAYPSFDELLATCQRLRGTTIRRISESTEEELDRKPHAPLPGFEQVMTSIGHTCLLITLHEMVHYGQATVVRRAVGIPPLL